MANILLEVRGEKTRRFGQFYYISQQSLVTNVNKQVRGRSVAPSTGLMFYSFYIALIFLQK